MHEISFASVIRGNFLRGNGHDLFGGGVEGYAGQISISTSEGVEIYNNTVEIDPAAGSFAGITLWQGDRVHSFNATRRYPPVPPFGRAWLANNHVHHNTIRFVSCAAPHQTARNGLVSFFNSSAYFAAANNSWTDNSYETLSKTGGAEDHWWWCTQASDACKGYTFRNFQAIAKQDQAGNQINGSSECLISMRRALSELPPAVTVSTCHGSKTFASLSEAIDRLEHDDSNDDATISLRGGTHYVNETLRLRSHARKLDIRAHDPSQRALISGGVTITGWQQNGSRWRARLPEALNTQRYLQLFANDTRRLMARSSTLIYDTMSFDGLRVQYKTGQIPGNLHNPQDIFAVVYEIWDAGKHTIVAQNSTNRTLSLSKKVYFANATEFNRSWSGSRFYLENVREFLTPGRFYHDRVEGMIVYMPAPGEDPQSMVFVVPAVTELISSDGANDLSFTNIDFAFTSTDIRNCLAASCADQEDLFESTAALHFKMGREIHLINVSVRHVGGNGVWFDGCNDSSLTQSVVQDAGANGVVIGGVCTGSFIDGVCNATEPHTYDGQPNWPRRPDGTFDYWWGHISTRIFIIDSVIADGGVLFQAAQGISILQADSVIVEHNDIHDFHFNGIGIGYSMGYCSSGSGNHSVRFNHVWNIGNDLDEVNCIYNLGESHGTVIDSNLCHDVISYQHGSSGIGLDAGSQGIRVSNNVVHRTKCLSLWLHYGTDIIIENNLFAHTEQPSDNIVGCIEPGSPLSRGAINSGKWAPGYYQKHRADSPHGEDGDISGMAFERNIIVFNSTFGGTAPGTFLPVCMCTINMPAASDLQHTFF